MKAAIIFLNIILFAISIVYRNAFFESIGDPEWYFRPYYFLFANTAFLNLVNTWNSRNQKDFLKPFRINQVAFIANGICFLSYILSIWYGLSHNNWNNESLWTLYWASFKIGWLVHLAGLTSFVSLLDILIAKKSSND